MGSEEAGFAAFALFNLLFVVLWLVMMAASVALLVCFVLTVVEVARTPPWQFEWPGEPVKTSWLLGLAIGTVIPFGSLVTTIVAWRQVRGAKRAGQLAGRPFWMAGPAP